MDIDEWPTADCLCVRTARPAGYDDRYVFYEFDAGEVAGSPIQATPGPVFYVGHTQPRGFPTEKSYDEVPDAVLALLRENGYTPVTGVDVDLSNAEPL